jgi:hypothetical protein
MDFHSMPGVMSRRYPDQEGWRASLKKGLVKGEDDPSGELFIPRRRSRLCGCGKG